MKIKLVTACLLFPLLTACAGKSPQRQIDPEPPASLVRTPEQIRINELERQLADRQRQCAEEKRRQDTAVRDVQKKADDLQKKLDALIAIDRELRARSKVR